MKITTLANIFYGIGCACSVVLLVAYTLALEGSSFEQAILGVVGVVFNACMIARNIWSEDD